MSKMNPPVALDILRSAVENMIRDGKGPSEAYVVGLAIGEEIRALRKAVEDQTQMIRRQTEDISRGRRGL